MQNNILEYLDVTCRRVPDKLAFSDGVDGLTFGELYSQARAVGSYLAAHGIYGEPVAVLMNKHPRAVAAFFGAVFGGCYYVPLDTEMPPVRLSVILQTVRPRVIICDEKTEDAARAVCDADTNVVLYSEASSTPIDDSALDDIRRRAIDVDPIYIVFTSGSTGIPKGVVACHRSVIDYIENLSEVLRFSEDTIFGNQSPLYFDACLKELYPTVKFGATTYLIPKSLFMFPLRLIRFINEHKINTICWVVSALTMISSTGALESEVPSSLHTIAFGSEVFPPAQLRKWRAALPNADFVNLYGPTEATGMSCWYRVTRDFKDDEAIPIGRPFKNTGILLITEDGRLAGPGEEGEICIRGTPLTLGYYNNPEQTDKSFVQNPFQPHFRELIYKTGDIGKYNEDGDLVFLSRRDHQIKHMGHRIELGELEMAILPMSGVISACAIYDKENSRIVLFYTGTAERSDVTTFLKERLPRYMLPNTIIKLDEMPLTPNGKRDRMALLQLYESGKYNCSQ